MQSEAFLCLNTSRCLSHPLTSYNLFISKSVFHSLSCRKYSLFEYGKINNYMYFGIRLIASFICFCFSVYTRSRPLKQNILHYVLRM